MIASTKLNLSADDVMLIQRVLDGMEELPEVLFDKLFDHYCNNGEMPYGVAKARTGDPYTWVVDHMAELLA